MNRVLQITMDLELHLLACPDCWPLARSGELDHGDTLALARYHLDHPDWEGAESHSPDSRIPSPRPTAENAGGSHSAPPRRGYFAPRRTK